jgi:hypothetical protein
MEISMQQREFQRGQIVEITRIDQGDDPRWLGLRGTVGDIYLYEYTALVNKPPSTKIFPLIDRPDGSDTVDPRGWFFWPTADLKLIEDSDD